MFSPSITMVKVRFGAGKGKGGSKKARKSKAVSKSLTSNQKKAVKQIVKASAETKYVVSDTIGSLILQEVPTGITVPTSFYNPVPLLGQGSASNERDGQKITNVRGRTHFLFTINDKVLASINWEVKLFMLTAKEAKSWNAVQSSGTANTLLDKGNATTTDWDPLSFNVVQLSMMPLSHEDFRGKTKTFRLSKNSGAMNADSATPPPSPNGGHYATSHRFTWNWKHKTLLYDDQTAGLSANLPTNYAPFWVAVAYPVDGYNITAEGAITKPILMTVRNEMYFKDV